MADITLANSTYSTGTNDTASTLVNNVTATDAQQYNGAATAIVGIETILGTGTDLKGSVTDLVARLAVEHNADGTQKTLTVAKGGSGATSLADGGVLVGNGTSAVQAIAVPTVPRVLVASGTAATDPAWEAGLIYQGPLSCGSGSTRSHEGTVTLAVSGNYSGIHYYTNFTLNSGVTMTVPAGKRRLIIVASGTITVNGIIDGIGAGAPAGMIAGSYIVEPGTDQPGGGANTSVNRLVTLDGTGGGTYTYNTQLQGGDVRYNGSLISAGGNPTPTQVTGSDVLPANLWMGAMGGAAGAPASVESGVGFITTAGGAGGASIVLIAPIIVLAATAILKTSGVAGASGSGAISGGGGAGNVYMLCRSYTDNGCTFTQTGGAAGGAGAGAGMDGVKQVLVYA